MPDKTPVMGEGVYVTGPNCWKCHYFAVSWDHTKPYACRLMGFKSPQLPCRDVLQIDGRHCRGFVAKPTRSQV